MPSPCRPFMAVFFFVVVRFSFNPCVDRCHVVLSLVQYTQAPNELVFLLGFGCLVVVAFITSNLM